MEGKGIEIMITPEHLFSVFGMPVTNTVIATLCASAVLIVFALVARRKLVLASPSGIQNVFEMVIESAVDMMEEILGDRKIAQKIFPFVMTVFLFILTANWMEFLPGVGSFLFHSGEHTFPLLRSVNTDLNVTLALAAMAVIVIQVIGITVVGAKKHIHKYFNFSGPVSFFIGLIELLSEVTRLISFSFRLFGNIFAGEVLILVMSYFLPVFLPVPFMLFEVMVGIIQAIIFAGLTLIFVKVAITHTENH